MIFLYIEGSQKQLKAYAKFDPKCQYTYHSKYNQLIFVAFYQSMQTWQGAKSAKNPRNESWNRFQLIKWGISDSEMPPLGSSPQDFICHSRQYPLSSGWAVTLADDALEIIKNECGTVPYCMYDMLFFKHIPEYQCVPTLQIIDRMTSVILFFLSCVCL